MSIGSEIEEIVREMGPVTVAEIAQLMPHTNSSNLAAHLCHLENKGLVSSERIDNPKGRARGHRSVKRYTIGGTPRAKPHKLKSPTPKAQAFNDSELRGKIAELEAWKASAIARYPDLGVDPDVLAARKIVHKMLIESHERNLAADVIAGKKDETMLVRAVVAALTERN